MIIFINGPLGSGKSTVAKLLKKKISKSVIIEPDDIRAGLIRANGRIVPIDEIVPLILKKLITALKSRAKKDGAIIVPYPLSYKNYRFLKRLLKNLKTPMYFFTLNPSMKSILNGRGKRTLDEWEKSRIQYHYKIAIHRPKFGIVIDNSKLTPRATAKRIFDLLLFARIREGQHSPRGHR